MTTRVAVIGGGQNCEHDVSLASAESIRSALNPERYDAVSLTIERDGRWSGDGVRSLSEAIDVIGGCDVVFPALHGPRGEDGTIAALCELAGVAYVGAGIGAGAIAMDKWTTKLVAAALGIATAPAQLVTRGQPTAARAPVVVKPVSAGSSFGVALVTDVADFDRSVEAAFEFDDRVLVEDYIVGREVDVAVLARADGSVVVGPPLEIVAAGLFDTATKYDGSADFRVPAELDPLIAKELALSATAVFDALGCRGVARIDFFVTDDGLVLGEVNTMPGMTAHSQVPRMFAAAGLDYADVLDELIAGAMSSSRAS